jgi:small subunit ribosomal protein S7
MPRRRRVEKRELLPDPRYGSVLATAFVNNLMRQGKKSVAEAIFYGAMNIMEDRTSKEALETFQRAVENVKPVVEVRSRRVGGATYQVPIEVRSGRRQALAIRWLINAAKGRIDKTMAERLANELMDAARRDGSAYKRREDTHRMAEANRAFAHYRW